MLIQLNLLLNIEVEKVCSKAFDGQEALDLVKRDVQRCQQMNRYNHCNFKLILMDCNMPVMDGYEATRCIRKFLHQEGIPQPIIVAVTGHSEQSYVERAINGGMNMVLSKPVNLKILKELAQELGF